MKIYAKKVYQCLLCATLCYPLCNIVIPLLCCTKFHKVGHKVSKCFLCIFGGKKNIFGNSHFRGFLDRAH